MNILYKLNYTPLILTLKLATISIVILLMLGIPLAWWLSKTKYTFIKIPIEAIITLPLILPPTVLGFYLLLLLGPNGFIGKTFIYITGVHLAFTFKGLIIGSCIYSLPFVIQPLQIAFEKIDKYIIDLSIMLKLSKINIFLFVVLPLSKRGILSATVLGFSHILGEFGVVLMIGGNIPNETQVISIAIYELVEQLEYTSAHILSFVMLIGSLMILILLFYLNDYIKK